MTQKLTVLCLATPKFYICYFSFLTIFPFYSIRIRNDHLLKLPCMSLFRCEHITILAASLKTSVCSLGPVLRQKDRSKITMLAYDLHTGQCHVWPHTHIIYTDTKLINQLIINHALFFVLPTHSFNNSTSSCRPCQLLVSPQMTSNISIPNILPSALEIK